MKEESDRLRRRQYGEELKEVKQRYRKRKKILKDWTKWRKKSSRGGSGADYFQSVESSSDGKTSGQKVKGVFIGGKATKNKMLQMFRAAKKDDEPSDLSDVEEDALEALEAITSSSDTASVNEDLEDSGWLLVPDDYYTDKAYSKHKISISPTTGAGKWFSKPRNRNRIDLDYEISRDVLRKWKDARKKELQRKYGSKTKHELVKQQTKPRKSSNKLNRVTKKERTYYKSDVSTQTYDYMQITNLKKPAKSILDEPKKIRSQVKRAREPKHIKKISVNLTHERETTTDDNKYETKKNKKCSCRLKRLITKRTTVKLDKKQNVRPHTQIIRKRTKLYQKSKKTKNPISRDPNSTEINVKFADNKLLNNVTHNNKRQDKYRTSLKIPYRAQSSRPNNIRYGAKTERKIPWLFRRHRRSTSKSIQDSIRKILHFSKPKPTVDSFTQHQIHYIDAAVMPVFKVKRQRINTLFETKPKSTVTNKLKRARKSWGQRYVSWFYKTCCKVYCWITFFLLIGATVFLSI